MTKQHTLLLLFVLLFLLLIGTGIAVDGPMKSLRGFWELQFLPSRLISDFIELRGIGATLINGSAVGIVALLFILGSKVPFSGPTFAAIFTIVGFGFFGKTVVNILPIFFGVWLSARYAGKTFSQYLIIALFGTALGPLVSTLAFEIGITGAPAYLAAAAGGTLTGFLLPALAISMLHLHQGYNLYNIGLTCGFFGLFAASFIRAGGHQFAPLSVWFRENPPVLILLVPVLSLLLILSGLISEKGKAFKHFYAIRKHPGRLPSDFMELESVGGALVNAGIVGLLWSLYLLLIGAHFNGPVIGGLFTIIGFATFGTHPKNSLPVLAGVVASTLLFGMEINAPGPVLAAIFATTLGPLAGQFGPIMGFVAGFIHLVMVSFTGSWHGAMNLYNNGFAGGLTAALLVAIIQWYQANRAED
jgi:hypothetical protein